MLDNARYFMFQPTLIKTCSSVGVRLIATQSGVPDSLYAGSPCHHYHDYHLHTLEYFKTAAFGKLCMYHVLILENDINERQHTYPDVILLTANIYSLPGGVKSVVNGWRYLMLAGEKESRFSVGPD